MDAETGAILALQILALCSIVAALLAYLMRQSRNATDEYESRNKRHVLVTSCDTCVGLQIALALYEAGYKVFAGLLDPSSPNSPSMKILRAIEQQKEREEDPASTSHGNPQEPEVRARGQIVPLELDSTREDSLRACLDAVRAKLPAGEDGLWAIVHTGGLALPGAIERQPSSAWESMLRHNLVAPLRTARMFIPLLRAKRGRIVLLGDSATSYGSKIGTGLVAYSASRKAVEGAAEALKSELQSSGVDVVLLRPPPVNPLILYNLPVLKTCDVESGIISSEGTWTAPVSTYAIQNSLIPALTSPCPRISYDMAAKAKLFCR
ncbi:D-beta-hydroxybutyrate dehydrogenase, mitochondrial [Frieseomelitta varia]|uniref:D-beta-hydroxybutyrate dehydrogenase, mitochondrial n=1 Tax=Frieseomelitta varia TaxID=561572 RepID=UPI001CB6868B|nr:D-beta-hydroxybutyrate dehydrogenase, mitochondrial [Frieseomelitta varia]XP_043510839.1 D-beta-hydroxybutyrate dehydrogenase, mitochondrial [Frieseomelitta varia]XP_043510840.1 D-beta-hydroxybutyrate dehydrogenase, mitochondrial [Frieseomelitta varia]XP_043510841.1 D-beta-hydroxybutyrate dehydrogenase, mitochondrial [Frieseomelitta varia]XP_043510842.1 D-beta-hydroxybutyrate dehydrogenase, mitochondrial [Frieseomelitta varia]